MFEITIDGKFCACEKGEFLLDVARRNGFDIPTLCHHAGLPGQGCCRLCLVEVMERGRGKVVVSCVYPLERPCEVLTNSERVREDRAVVLMLLRQRAPASPEIAALCEKYGAMEGDRFKALDRGKCVMCGLCVKACGEIGGGAISTVGRGTGKKISTPYDEPSSHCVGCLSCAQICPTQAIPWKEDDDGRTIWGRTFDLVRCESCGAVIGTPEELAWAAEKAGQPIDKLCSECRRSQISNTLAHTYGIE